MNYISTSASDRRQAYRLAVHHDSRLTLALDGPEPGDEAIHGVTLTDISHEGLMAANAGHLVPGVRVLLEVPLVGWREAEVRWIAGNRAGCRFAQPLTLDELRRAALSSERLAHECPELARAISEIPQLARPAPARAPEAATTPAIGRFGPWHTSLSPSILALTAASFLIATWLLDHLA